MRGEKKVTVCEEVLFFLLFNFRSCRGRYESGAEKQSASPLIKWADWSFPCLSPAVVIVQG